MEDNINADDVCAFVQIVLADTTDPETPNMRITYGASSIPSGARLIAHMAQAQLKVASASVAAISDDTPEMQAIHNAVFTAEIIDALKMLAAWGDTIVGECISLQTSTSGSHAGELH